VNKAYLSKEEIRRRVTALGPWFHNLDLDGVATAPSHFLGDYPRVKWRHFSDVVPTSLKGKTVLDTRDEYLAQARFAAEVNGLDVEFRNLSVYDVGMLHESFDLVIFMGVLYHLRHPLLALDLIYEHAAADLMLFQSMQRGSERAGKFDQDYDFWRTDPFDSDEFPKLHFIEHRYADDPTNWWIPNRSCAEAMLRSAGFVIAAHPEPEVYLCRRGKRPHHEDAYMVRRTGA
jgi:tRNA (mo5U34)-methyltransferase